MSARIDWEQRRFEIAKSVMAAYYSTEYATRDYEVSYMAENAVKAADELIKKLKEDKK